MLMQYSEVLNGFIRLFMENKIKFIIDHMKDEKKDDTFDNDWIELTDNLIVLRKENDDCVFYTLNKYEFQHMCKELMKENSLCVWSGNGYNKSIGYECSITHFMFGGVKTFKADTEFEAVVNATYALVNYELDFDEDESEV